MVRNMQTKLEKTQRHTCAFVKLNVIKYATTLKCVLMLNKTLIVTASLSTEVTAELAAKVNLYGQTRSLRCSTVIIKYSRQMSTMSVQQPTGASYSTSIS